MGGSAHNRRNVPPDVLPSEDSTDAVTGGVVGADGVDADVCGALVDGAAVACALAVSVGAEAEAGAGAGAGADGTDVGATLAAGGAAALGACAGVSLVPPVFSLHATAAIETNATSIQTNFRMTLPVVFAIQPI